MTTDSTDPLDRPIKSMPPLELARVVSLAEAARLAGLSEDTIRRRHGDKIIKLSPRRSGMRTLDALTQRAI
jgi:hypothetical protein